MVGSGKGGIKGAKKQVRVVLIMQKPVLTPVEFALPPEGSLMIVQMDDRWAFISKDYTRSNKKNRDQTWKTRQDVEYDDTGNGAYTFSSCTVCDRGAS
jgi:hypothetical protein